MKRTDWVMVGLDVCFAFNAVSLVCAWFGEWRGALFAIGFCAGGLWMRWMHRLGKHFDATVGTSCICPTPTRPDPKCPSPLCKQPSTPLPPSPVARLLGPRGPPHADCDCDKCRPWTS